MTLDEWYATQLKKVGEFKLLKHNWNGLGSEPPNARSIINIKCILDMLYISPYLHQLALLGTVYPSGEGGLAICFKLEGNKWRDVPYAEVECDNDGEVIFLSDSDIVLCEIIDRDRSFDILKGVSKLFKDSKNES